MRAIFRFFPFDFCLMFRLHSCRCACYSYSFRYFSVSIFIDFIINISGMIAVINLIARIISVVWHHISEIFRYWWKTLLLTCVADEFNHFSWNDLVATIMYIPVMFHFLISLISAIRNVSWYFVFWQLVNVSLTCVSNVIIFDCNLKLSNFVRFCLQGVFFSRILGLYKLFFVASYNLAYKSWVCCLFTMCVIPFICLKLQVSKNCVLRLFLRALLLFILFFSFCRPYFLLCFTFVIMIWW